MKNALITGASSGIGLATAKLMLSSGARVTGMARDFAETECAGMQQVSVDLSELDSLPNTLQRQDALNQPFDCLILNAGYGRFGGIEQFSHQQIRHLVDVNLISNLFLLKHYLPRFKRNGGQDIVLIGSESALSGGRQGAVYCASKFAIRGLAQSLRADCANNDIRVILVNPGAVASDFFDDLHFHPSRGEEFAISVDSVAQTIVSALQQPRTTVIEEINLQPIKKAYQKR
ncbi:MAG: SDR family oxidoreductase [Gammaproteobacteria bacterium]|nr:SDR family oxidoreductase [Gammaproteobacteria bacterium]